MKYLFILATFIASLSFMTGFALTIQECDNLLKNRSGEIDPLKVGSLSLPQIIDCASPDAAKTEPLSPLSIFQIIINSVAVLAFGLAILAIVVSAIKVATSAGDKAKFQEGITLLKNAGVAVILTLTAYTILYIILNTFGFTI
jgi:hypothetical protein